MSKLFGASTLVAESIGYYSHDSTGFVATVLVAIIKLSISNIHVDTCML